MKWTSFIKGPGVAALLLLLAIENPLASAQVVSTPVLFDAPRNFLSGDGVLSIVSADFNNDGLLDFATSNKKTDSVSVHLSQGSGIFSEPWDEYHVGPFLPPTSADKKPKALPIGVAAGDFNKDGCSDLVVANSQADTVSVLLNVCDGSGTFGLANDFTIRHDAQAPDAENTANIHIFDPEDVTVGDFDGDGNLDILTANIGGSRVSLLFGDGLGSFASPMQYFVGSEPISVIAVDVNNDNALDIVTSNNGPEIIQLIPGSPILVPKYTVSVLRNLGDGTFATELRYQVGPNPVKVIAADLNKDGFMDLITANHVVAGAPAPNPSWVSVLMNQGSGTFKPELQVATDLSPNSVAAADLNGNGLLDLITVQNYTPGTFAVSTQNPDGTFAPFLTYSPGVMNAPNVLVTGDFDGDGDHDLLASSKNSDDFSLLLNQVVGNPPPPMGLPPVGGDPDLTVSITKVKAGFKNSETKFELQVEVRNIGGGPAVHWFVIQASLGGNILHTWNIFDGVQAGLGVVLKYKTLIPGSVAGQELSVVVDSEVINPVGWITESDETNNTATQMIQIQ